MRASIPGSPCSTSPQRSGSRTRRSPTPSPRRSKPAGTPRSMRSPATASTRISATWCSPPTGACARGGWRGPACRTPRRATRWPRRWRCGRLLQRSWRNSHRGARPASSPRPRRCARSSTAYPPAGPCRPGRSAISDSPSAGRRRCRDRRPTRSGRPGRTSSTPSATRPPSPYTSGSSAWWRSSRTASPPRRPPGRAWISTTSSWPRATCSRIGPPCGRATPSASRP